MIAIIIAIARRLWLRLVSITRGLWADDIGHKVIVSLGVVVGLIFYTAIWFNLGKASGAEKVRTKIERQIIHQTGKETVRRETVLVEVQNVLVPSLRKKIDAQATKIAALQEESARASHANDDRLCLPADAVRRLSAVD